MSGYQIFLMIELARIANLIKVNLEYDETWKQGVELNNEFEVSTFNDTYKPRYECIEAFLKDKADKADVELISTNSQAKYDQATKTLEKMGYQVDNLWHIDDVKGRFECTDEEAMDVLIAALNNEATFEQIWFALEYEAEDVMGLKRVEDEDEENDEDEE